MNKEEILFYEGQLATVTLPSGKKVTVRETNGDDDQLLSNFTTAANGKNIYHYLSSVIKKDEDTGSTLVTPEEISQWKTNDVWFLVFKLRVLNHGDKLEFTFTGPQDSDKPEKYTEDLSLIDVDLGATPQTEEDKRKVEAIMYPNKSAAEVEFITSRGNKFKFNILSVEEDRKLLDTDDSNKHNNLGLLSRKLRIFKDNTWVLVKHFGAFPSKEMMEIRGHVNKLDPKFNPIVKFIYQGEFITLPLFSIKDFFWPETI